MGARAAGRAGAGRQAALRGGPGVRAQRPASSVRCGSPAVREATAGGPERRCTSGWARNVRLRWGRGGRRCGGVPPREGGTAPRLGQHTVPRPPAHHTPLWKLSTAGFD